MVKLLLKSFKVDQVDNFQDPERFYLAFLFFIKENVLFEKEALIKSMIKVIIVSNFAMVHLLCVILNSSGRLGSEFVQIFIVFHIYGNTKIFISRN